MSSVNAERGSVLTGRGLREAVRRAIEPVLDLQEYRLILFGSEAAGAATRTSDIDIGILGPRPIPGATMSLVREALESLRTLRRFDVVDLTRVDDAFRAEALRHAEPL